MVYTNPKKGMQQLSLFYTKEVFGIKLEEFITKAKYFVRFKTVSLETQFSV